MDDLLIAFELREANTALLTSGFRVGTRPAVLCLRKALDQVGRRSRPLRLVVLTVVVAETGDADDGAHGDHAALAEGHVANEDHEAEGGRDSWVNASGVDIGQCGALFPVVVVEDVAPDVPGCVDGQDDHSDQ